ncbi:hypothetical protein DA803_00990 [[Mycoplasma] phocae]|uniref:Uncharacterized protein n=1 Tax=[Mycoplasma] phocae TaxID=142651 RepID=A0A2Z5IQ38_9BACT|nr:hypothetical protein [[Mycoplasma] phocae]AXE60667.1 hypothetical protein DA803_00990 [[Mycoplasma] phocae]
MKKSKKILYILTPIVIALSSTVVVSCIIPNNSSKDLQPKPKSEKSNNDINNKNQDIISKSPMPNNNEIKNPDNLDDNTSNKDQIIKPNLPEVDNAEKNKENNMGDDTKNSFPMLDDKINKNDEEKDKTPPLNNEQQDDKKNINIDDKKSDLIPNPDNNISKKDVEEINKKPNIENDEKNNEKKQDELNTIPISPDQEENDTDKNKVLDPIVLDNEKINELITILNLNMNIPVSLNLDKFIKEKNEKIVINSLDILAFSDLTGDITISVEGMYDKHPFSLQKHKISGFKSVQEISKNNIKATINKNNLIGDKKTINDINLLKNEELINYIDIESNDVLINEFYKKGLLQIKSFNFDLSTKLVNFDFVYKYKVKRMNKDEKISSLPLSAFRILIQNIEIKDDDILNYILENEKINSSKINFSQYASIYEGRWQQDKKLLNYLFNSLNYEEFKNKYFNRNGELFIDINSVTSNDIDGILYLSYTVTYQNESDVAIRSKNVVLKIEGFPKILNDNRFKNYGKDFLIIGNISNPRYKKLLTNLYNEYGKKLSSSELEKLEIKEKNKVIRYFGFPSWSVLKLGANGYEIKNNSSWLFKYKGGDIIADTVKEDAILEDSITHEKILSLKGIIVEPLKIYNMKIENGRFDADFEYKITFIVSADTGIYSDNPQNIEVIDRTTVFLSI